MKTLAFLLLLALGPFAHGGDTLPPVDPTAGAAAATLSLAGSPALREVANRWIAGFARLQPGVTVEVHFTGSDTGMAELYTGRADVVLLGREPTASEIQAFEWVYRYRPAMVEILTGSLDRAGRSPALVVFVHRDNPLARISVEQLARAFGPEPVDGSAPLRRWGQLGLSGNWASRPIHLYGPDMMSGTGRFFRHAVLGEGRLLNWESLAEFGDSGLSAHDAGPKILAALAADPEGLAVAWLGADQPAVRPVPLQAKPDAPAVAATRETLRERTYPLTRAVWAYYHRKPGQPASPAIRDFLRYVLSAEGQQAADSAAGFLPLTPDAAAAQVRLLD